MDKNYEAIIAEMEKTIQLQANRIAELEAENERLAAKSERAEDNMLRDEMTGLYKKKGIRKYFRDQLSDLEKMESCTVVEVDMDNFKDINDIYGHVAGDEAIKIVAFSLQSLFETKDLVVRAGGDEFLVFIKNLPESELDQKLEDVRTAITMSLNRFIDHRAIKDGKPPRDGKNFGLSIGYTSMDVSQLSEEMIASTAFETDWLNPQLEVCDEYLGQDKDEREKQGLRHKR